MTYKGGYDKDNLYLAYQFLILMIQCIVINDIVYAWSTYSVILHIIY